MTNNMLSEQEFNNDDMYRMGFRVLLDTRTRVQQLKTPATNKSRLYNIRNSKTPDDYHRRASHTSARDKMHSQCHDSRTCSTTTSLTAEYALNNHQRRAKNKQHDLH
jgi:hypothetical protein